MKRARQAHAASTRTGENGLPVKKERSERAVRALLSAGSGVRRGQPPSTAAWEREGSAGASGPRRLALRGNGCWVNNGWFRPFLHSFAREGRAVQRTCVGLGSEHPPRATAPPPVGQLNAPRRGWTEAVPDAGGPDHQSFEGKIREVQAPANAEARLAAGPPRRDLGTRCCTGSHRCHTHAARWQRLASHAVVGSSAPLRVEPPFTPWTGVHIGALSQR